MEHILRSKNQLITKRNTTCHDKDIEITDFAEKKPCKNNRICTFEKLTVLLSSGIE